MTPVLTPPPSMAVDRLLERALAEDLGGAGDITTDGVVPSTHVSVAELVARRPGRMAGIEPATRVFALLDPGVDVDHRVADGDDVATGTTLATLRGPTRALLTGERTCLNLLGRLCGVATATAAMVAAIEGTGARITDTRKTTPGLRALEKYAVRCGGGVNHRFGLDDAVLIKDNHIAAVGSIGAAVAMVRGSVGHRLGIEVEVDDLDQLDQALAVGVGAVLLDNMDPATLADAVRRVGGRCLTEASGNVTPETVRTVAETGVDLISVGWLTHSAIQLDVSLDLDR